MKLHYVTGSRADYGLMSECLKAFQRHPNIELSIIATGQALIDRYGNVAREIATSGLQLASCIPVTLSGAGPVEMAVAFADEVRGFADFWSTVTPDLVMLLGDRGEMLAAAVVAHHLGIPIAHIHGGERSGTLDDGFRHAISKLANYHFVASDDSRRRLLRMGEAPEAVWTVGAPGLVDVRKVASGDEGWLRNTFDLPKDGPSALMLFHPVVEEASSAYQQTTEVLSALDASGSAVLILRPNSDAGGAAIDRCISTLARGKRMAVRDHLSRDVFLRALASVDYIIGNSSSGIIESASLGTACVNLGTRQDGRLRNANTIDCPTIVADKILAAIQKASALRGPFENRYGDGRTDARIVEILNTLSFDEPPKKRNAY